jgi:LytS/YehU family sensor histidine kinase
VALTVRAIPESLEEHHRFRLAGKSAVHYVVLALAIVFPLLTLYALVACVRTKMSWQKWPWMLFILFGIGSFSINWTTGETQFSALTLRLFGASAAAVLYGPWILSVSFPLGALVFLFRRKALTAAAPAA